MSHVRANGVLVGGVGTGLGVGVDVGVGVGVDRVGGTGVSARVGGLGVDVGVDHARHPRQTEITRHVCMTARGARKSLATPAFVSFLVAIMALISAGSSHAEAPAYDLETCIERALESSRQLRGAEEKQLSAEAQADQARAQRWPTLALEAGGGYISEVNEITLPAPLSRTLRFGDNDSWEIAAGLELPLYTGGTLSATERARKAAAEASAYDVAADSLRLIHDVRRAFLGALGAEEGERAAQLSVNRIARHVEELEERIELGASSEEMRLGAESRLRAAEQRLIGAQEQAEIARFGLGTLLGLPGQPIAPQGSLDAPLQGSMELRRGAPIPADAASTSAQGEGRISLDSPAPEVLHRPEVQALEQRRRAGAESRRAAEGSYLPSVSAKAQFHYGNPGVKVIENDWMDWATARVQLRWTLWDSGARAAEVRSRSAEVRAVEEAQAGLREQLEHALAVAREQVAARENQLKTAEERTELENRRLELVSGRTHQGLGTESELLDVQDDLTEAEVALASARAALRIAEADLLYAVGR